MFKNNEQWSLTGETLEKRCWDGYKPTPGKKAYEKGSCTKKTEEVEKNANCAPGSVNGSDMDKVDVKVAPEGSNNRKTYKENVEKEDHEDKKEDEKLIDKKIKEHEEKKHSLSEHKKQHEKLKIAKNGQWSIEKEDLQKNPLIGAAVGAAATGFGSKMADRVSDKIGL